MKRILQYFLKGIQLVSEADSCLIGAYAGFLYNIH